MRKGKADKKKLTEYSYINILRSEYLVIVMPALTQHYVLLQRNLLYTGITRGKKMVALVRTKKAIAIAIRNNKPQKRYPLLKDGLSTTHRAIFKTS